MVDLVLHLQELVPLLLPVFESHDLLLKTRHVLLDLADLVKEIRLGEVVFQLS